MDRDKPETNRSRKATRGPDEHVAEVVQQAHQELRELLNRRAEIVRRIGSAKRTIAGLASLFGEGIFSDELLEMIRPKLGRRGAGLTNACRMILMESPRALSTREIRDQLQQEMPSVIVHHKDSMASVTTVLNRLQHYGEVQVVETKNGGRGWRWVS